MQISLAREHTTATVSLNGRFDFNTLPDFRQICDALPGEAELQRVQVDFLAVDYLDSSALSVLLMLREKLMGAGKEIVLTGVHGNVRQVLDVANFNRLFSIV